MGNRAVITASKSRRHGVGIYVQWNGGPESVLAFLAAAKERGYRAPDSDAPYAMGRLCGLIHEFFGVGAPDSLGLGPLSGLDCDNHDNGVYVIGGDWEIADRWGHGSAIARTLAELGEGELAKYKEIVAALALPPLAVKQAA